MRWQLAIGTIPWEVVCRLGSRIERQYDFAPVPEPSMKPPKSVFACQSCGAQSPKWLGRCPDCGEWNSIVEERAVVRRRSREARSPRSGDEARNSTPTSIRSSPSAWARASPSSTACSAAVWSPVRSCCLAASRDRQVHAAAAGGGALRRARRPRALLLGRGVGAPDQDARRAARRYRRTAVSCWRKPASNG